MSLESLEMNLYILLIAEVLVLSGINFRAEILFQNLEVLCHVIHENPPAGTGDILIES